MGLVYITKFAACVSFLTLCFSSATQANPSGATVANGTVSFSQPNASTLNITNTPGAIVNWQQFGIAQGELTRFIQQSASSAILNRVTGQDPSQILGQLQSNGRVFLINPNGVIFGQNAVIDTAGMIASTLNLSDDNFLNGHLHFEDLANNATILNQGFIHTSNAGEVVLVAPTVQNEGVIDVEDGHLVLAAGQSVTISSLNYDNIEFEVQAPANKVVNIGDLLSDGGSIGVFAGSIHNSGTISANAITVNDAGEIVLVAQGDNVQQDGTVTATSETGQGGHIEILGERVGLFGETDSRCLRRERRRGSAGRWRLPGRRRHPDRDHHAGQRHGIHPCGCNRSRRRRQGDRVGGRFHAVLWSSNGARWFHSRRRRIYRDFREAEPGLQRHCRCVRATGPERIGAVRSVEHYR